MRSMQRISRSRLFMANRIRQIGIFTFIVVSQSVVAAASGASFVPLGDLPGGSTVTTASAVNDLGMVVGTSSSVNSSDGEGFRWSSTTGMRGLGDLPGGPFFSTASGISTDGTVVVGRSFAADGNRAFTWSENTGMNQLASSSSLAPMYANAVSGDGTVVVGLGTASAGNTAYRWTAQSGAIAIAGASSNATAISADGKVIYGGVGNQTFRWSVDGELQALPFVGLVSATSADGSFATGNMSTGLGQTQAFRWSAQGGLQLLGDLPGGNVFSIATSISADGKTIVGYSQGNGPFLVSAFIWDEVHGMRSLQDVLSLAGVSFGAFIGLTSANGISPDGRFIVGDGATQFAGTSQAWLASLVVSAPVPEPEIYAMLLTGLGLIGFVARRKARKSA
jgi:probable HAF family extracellular repeat protein